MTHIRSDADRAEAERRDFAVIANYDDPSYFEAHLARYGQDSEMAATARLRIADLRRRRDEAEANLRRQNYFLFIPLTPVVKLTALFALPSALLGVVISILALWPSENTEALAPSAALSDRSCLREAPADGSCPTDSVMTASTLNAEPAAEGAAEESAVVSAKAIVSASPTNSPVPSGGRALITTGIDTASPSDSFAVAPGHAKSPNPLVLVE